MTKYSKTLLFDGRRFRRDNGLMVITRRHFFDETTNKQSGYCDKFNRKHLKISKINYNFICVTTFVNNILFSMSILISESVRINFVESENVCKICQNYFEPPFVESLYCDKCKRWVYLDCSGISSHDLNFYCINKDPLYYKVCVIEFKLHCVIFDDYCKICYRRFSSVDNCLFCVICCKWVHLKFTPLSNKSFDELCKNCLPFYCKVSNPKMSLSCNCQLICKDTKRCCFCSLCYQKCHVECAVHLCKIKI